MIVMEIAMGQKIQDQALKTVEKISWGNCFLQGACNEKKTQLIASSIQLRATISVPLCLEVLLSNREIKEMKILRRKHLRLRKRQLLTKKTRAQRVMMLSSFIGQAKEKSDDYYII